MFLELADNGRYEMREGNHPYMRDENYSMLAAENEAIMLAQNPEAYQTVLAQNNTNDAYIFIPMPNTPGGGQFVREDLFDDLNELEYEAIMDQLDPYQLEDDYLAGKAARARRKARREQRTSAKQKRIETRTAARAKTGGLGGILQKATGLIGAAKGIGPAEPYPMGPAPEEEKNYTPFIIGGIALVVIGGIVIAVKAGKKK